MDSLFLLNVPKDVASEITKFKWNKKIQ